MENEEFNIIEKKLRIDPTIEEDFFTPQTRTKEAKVFGKWSVSLNGDMSYDGGRYPIYDSQLKDENWIAHMFEKGWIDWNEFIPAYFQACKNAGIKSMKMLIYY